MAEVFTPAFILQLFVLVGTAVLGVGAVYTAIRIDLALIHQRLDRIEDDYKRMRSTLGEL